MQKFVKVRKSSLVFAPLTCYNVFVKSVNKARQRSFCRAFCMPAQAHAHAFQNLPTVRVELLQAKAERSNNHEKKEFCYKPQFGVIVVCSDEKDQEATYNRLKAQGYRLKVVTV